MEKNKTKSRFLIRSKKAQMEEFIKIAIWVLFFIIASLGAYYLVKFLTNV